MKKIVFGLIMSAILTTPVVADSWLDQLQASNTEMIEAFGLGSGEHIEDKLELLTGTTEESSVTGSWDNGIAQVNSEIPKIPRLLDQFYLPDCRITQTTDQHYQTGHGSMYATDIACVRDTPFDVKAPRFNDIYTIKDIGHTPQLGNYMIIGWASGDAKYQIIFGHIETQLKVGDIVNEGAIIGNTNKSGMSTAVHLHAELWRGEDNLKRDFETVNDKSDRVFNQRRQPREDRDVEYIKNKVKALECKNGYTLKAYPDYKQYSIGCGTYSPVQQYGYTISHEDADRLFDKAVRKRITSTKRDLHQYNNNQRSALLSLYYNCPLCYNNVIKDPNKEIRLVHDKVCNTSTGVRQCNTLGGLTKRRKAERDLYNQ